MQLPFHLEGWPVPHSRVVLSSLQNAVNGCFVRFHSISLFSLCWDLATPGDSTSFICCILNHLGKKLKEGSWHWGMGLTLNPRMRWQGWGRLSSQGQSGFPKIGRGGAGWTSLLPSKGGKESGLHPPGRCSSTSNMEELPPHTGLLGLKEEVSPHCLFLAS